MPSSVWHAGDGRPRAGLPGSSRRCRRGSASFAPASVWTSPIERCWAGLSARERAEALEPLVDLRRAQGVRARGTTSRPVSEVAPLPGLGVARRAQLVPASCSWTSSVCWTRSPARLLVLLRARGENGDHHDAGERGGDTEHGADEAWASSVLGLGDGAICFILIAEPSSVGTACHSQIAQRRGRTTGRRGYSPVESHMPRGLDGARRSGDARHSRLSDEMASSVFPIPGAAARVH